METTSYRGCSGDSSPSNHSKSSDDWGNCLQLNQKNSLLDEQSMEDRELAPSAEPPRHPGEGTHLDLVEDVVPTARGHQGTTKHERGSPSHGERMPPPSSGAWFFDGNGHEIPAYLRATNPVGKDTESFPTPVSPRQPQPPLPATPTRPRPLRLQTPRDRGAPHAAAAQAAKPSPSATARSRRARAGRAKQSPRPDGDLHDDSSNSMATPSSSQLPPSITATSGPAAATDGGQENRAVVEISEDEGTVAPRNKRRLTSPVWDDFEQVCIDGVWKAKCLHCKKKLSATSKNGTTHLATHLKTCIYNNKKPGQKIQFNLRFGTTEKGTVSAENYVFDQEVARRALYSLIILHEYPLSIVDHHGFRKFVSSLQPLFKMGTRNTIRRDIMSFYEGEKRKARIFLQKTNCQIVDTESRAADRKPNGSFQDMPHSDEDDTEDEYNTSSVNAPGDRISNGNYCLDETETSCSFHRHVSHIITNEEVEALIKKNSKFKWEMPAVDIPRSKWVGTGAKVQGAYDDNLHDVKGKLRDHWQHVLSDRLNSRMCFFSLCNSYRDIMHCNKKPFYLKRNGMDSITMDAYLMHALNHVHMTRDVVLRNDAKLRNDAERDISDDNTYLDQGFTRPKVLFLLPFKNFARGIVKRLIQLSPLPQKDNAMGQFKKEFGESDDEMEIPEHSTKPADFDLLFAGDTDDHFLFGIKLTKKSIKLYSNFYSSDIIVASPLALKRRIDGGEHGKEKDFDFLSSIEIVVVDHADVISMQNWAHLEAVFEQLNHLPSKEHGTNVMRIRPWYLDQHAQYYRQTILLSSYLTPEINALFNGLCSNYEGKIKMVAEYSGVLQKIQLEVRQVYERLDASSITEADDARFDYFCNKVYPKIQDLDEGGLLLFVSSYFEYIRISNFLKSKEATFCRIGEATSQQDISRSRLWFFEGKKKILLYSERSHFYHRYKVCYLGYSSVFLNMQIRGTKHLLIYSLPERKEFYPELINMLGESENRKCNVLFSRLDLLKLERIVGTSSARRLISSDKSMFVFC
ncbi:hypothetical protein U9M48_033914 [Paspalum notatum var. saurae]|uniref:BED-type domain-containing protein n=1 Tax=Paspalum notatum var. saurae TaxID=547442 RepID=A0AAQ3U9G3_PASNO